MRTKGSVPHVFTASTLAHALHIAGTAVAHAHATVPSHPEVPTFVFSVHGDVCISVASELVRFVA